MLDQAGASVEPELRLSSPRGFVCCKLYILADRDHCTGSLGCKAVAPRTAGRVCQIGETAKQGNKPRVDAADHRDRPDVCEYEISDHVPEHDADDAISGTGQVKSGAWPLDDAEEECKSHLEADIGDARASGGYPCRDKARDEDDDQKRADRRQVRGQKNDRGKSERRADNGA